MVGKLFGRPGGWRRLAGVLLAALGVTGVTRGQSGPLPAMPVPVAAPTTTTTTMPGAPLVSTEPAAPAPDVQRTGCATCGGGLLGPPSGMGGGCSSCGGCGGSCYPGRKPCDCCVGDDAGPALRLLGGIYECICCPD